MNPQRVHDVSKKAVLDTVGNLYVTGTSALNQSNRNFQFATIKYNAQGHFLWFTHTMGISDAVPSAIQLDSSGNVVVAGIQNLFSSANMIVVKYAPNFTNISGFEPDIPLDFRQ